VQYIGFVAYKKKAL